MLLMGVHPSTGLSYIPVSFFCEEPVNQSLIDLDLISALARDAAMLESMHDRCQHP
jgi:hypothetical protein